jgi:hypothetical protein
MIKVSVTYPNKPGARFDHTYYRDKHMPLVKKGWATPASPTRWTEDLRGELRVRRPLM